MMKRCAGGKSRAGIVLLITALLCLAYCSPVSAALIPLNIELTGGVNPETGGPYTGYLTVWSNINLQDVYNNPDVLYNWSLPTGAGQPFYGGIEITAENHENVIMGRLNGISVQVKADPVLNLGFSVAAGDFATAFSFSTPLLTFDPLTNAQAYAEAGILVTGPGATLWGSYEGVWAYKALYNSTTLFSYLVNTPITGYSGGNTGTVALPGTITNMQSKFQFILSPHGMASGSSYYEIETVIPEPASMLLLGLGGLALIRKRRA